MLNTDPQIVDISGGLHLSRAIASLSSKRLWSPVSAHTKEFAPSTCAQVRRREQDYTSSSALKYALLVKQLNIILAVDLLMLKTIHLLKKKKGMSAKAFKEYWLDVHAKMVRKVPYIRRYVIWIAVGSPSKPMTYDGVVQLDFDNEKDLQRFYDSPQGRLIAKDTKNFAESIDVLYVEDYPQTIEK
jgi:uncharacterized protein (TIGR02118 family)